MPTYKIAPGLVQLPLGGEGYARATSSEYMTYGHKRLISTIETCTESAVYAIRQLSPLSSKDQLKVVVKDLNTADGEPAKGHKTHGAGGKNVDLGYFYSSAENPELIENRFLNHKTLSWVSGEGGRVLTAPHPLWHLEANWLLVRTLLTIPQVTQIMVDKLYAGPLEEKAKKYYGAGSPACKHALSRIQWYGNHDNHYHLTVMP